MKSWWCHSNTTKQQQTQQQWCLQRTKTATDHRGDADSGFQNILRTIFKPYLSFTEAEASERSKHLNTQI
jgi:hypothetical protein